MTAPGLQVETRIAGVTFDNQDGTSRQALIRLVSVGEQLSLVREPHNPFDHNAIALLAAEGKAQGKQLGFVPRSLAAVLAPLLDEGLQLSATIQRVVKLPRHGLWTPPVWAVRISLSGDISHVTLPVRTGLEPALTTACLNDEAECGDAPSLGGSRAASAFTASDAR
jgi:hypothetical protein